MALLTIKEIVVLLAPSVHADSAVILAGSVGPEGQRAISSQRIVGGVQELGQIGVPEEGVGEQCEGVDVVERVAVLLVEVL